MRIFLYLALLSWGGNVWASSKVEEKKQQLVQFNFLEKLTVGPDDNYQGDLNEQENSIAFSRKSNLSTKVYLQTIGKSDEKSLFDSGEDSMDPAFSPDGKKIALVSFKEDSLGDLCIVFDILSRKSKCFQIEGSVRSPKWINQEEIVFVKTDFGTKTSQLYKINLPTGTQTLLDSRRSWSPAVNRDKPIIAYNVVKEGDSRLVVFDMKSNQSFYLNFDLPGRSGFPEFSRDGKWLYFSHFFSDSNGDQVIDANDNGVIFRISVKKLTGKDKYIPQQLTSGQQNCSYPRLTDEYMYLTCDFEGSLDIYRTSVSGVIPKTWNKDQVVSAHRTSRNYHDRILTLNWLHNADRDLSKWKLALFSNFLLNEDLVAAKFMWSRIGKTNAGEREYLEVKFLNKRFPVKVNNRKFVTLVKKELKAAASIPGATSSLVQGLIHSYLGNKSLALKPLVEMAKNSESGISHYIYFDLLSQLVKKNWIDIPSLFKFYRPLLNSTTISLESQLFYLYQLFSTVENHFNLNERLNWLQVLASKTGLSSDLTTAWKSELAQLHLILAKSAADKEKQYKLISSVMSQSRNNYFLLKFIGVRGIENFLRANEGKYLTQVASLWLTYTDRNDTEFSYAREIYVNKVLSRAYLNFNFGQTYIAANNFFSAIGLADDLEAHFGYIKSMNVSDKASLALKRYEGFERRNVIGESRFYAKALFALSQIHKEMGITSGHMAVNIQKRREIYQKAQSYLELMPDSYAQPIYHLLVGFLKLQLLTLDKTWKHLSESDMSSAHKHLMLAYDLGRYNDRIKASALSNLASLHVLVENWGMVRGFIYLRNRLPYETFEQRIAQALTLARSHFYLKDYKAAIEVLGELERDKKLPAQFLPVILQRSGFYYLADQQWNEAKRQFFNYLKLYPKEDSWNLVRTHMALGYVLHKLGSDSESQFSEALTLLKNKILIKNLEKPHRSLAERLTVIANGYLAQNSFDIANVEQFVAELKRVESNLENLRMTKENWLLHMMKAQSQLVVLYKNKKQNLEAVHILGRVVEQVESHFDEFENEYNSEFYQGISTLACLTTVLKARALVPKLADKFVRLQVNLTKLGSDSPVIRFEKLRLKVLESALQKLAGTPLSSAEKKDLQVSFKELGKTLSISDLNTWVKFIKIYI